MLAHARARTWDTPRLAPFLFFRCRSVHGMWAQPQNYGCKFSADYTPVELSFCNSLTAHTCELNASPWTKLIDNYPSDGKAF